MHSATISICSPINSFITMSIRRFTASPLLPSTKQCDPRPQSRNFCTAPYCVNPVKRNYFHLCFFFTCVTSTWSILWSCEYFSFLKSKQHWTSCWLLWGRNFKMICGREWPWMQDYQMSMHAKSGIFRCKEGSFSYPRMHRLQYSWGYLQRMCVGASLFYPP